MLTTATNHPYDCLCLVEGKFFLERSKLGILSEIAALECESSCAVLGKKRDRNTMMKLRGGTAAFQIEVGRWKGVEREESTQGMQ